MRTLYHSSCDYGAVLEHILKVDEVAVVHMLCVVVRIVEVDYSLIVGFYDILRQEQTVCNISGNLTRHIISLS